jgi:PhzF family phenazine biosynthesis protein
MTHPVLRYAAFTDPTARDSAASGNPAGLVLDATSSVVAMQAIAAEVGYAETAFVTGVALDGDPRRSRLRYFSPVAEVPFCGHATIAAAVALAHRDGLGAFDFETPVGRVRIETSAEDGRVTASFTSVEPEVAPLADSVLDVLLSLRVAFAGNWHPVLVLAERAVFDGFVFDPAAMRELMDAQGWAGTVSVLRVVGEREFEARNLFPVGVITEDPATGSAAASLGGYLRSLGLAPAMPGEPTARVTVHQGAHVGRPSLLTVDIPQRGGIVVSGEAAEIAA